MELTIKRGLAFAIDYCVLAVYGGLIYLIATFLELQQAAIGPVMGQLISFFVLTLPVFLYFSLFEKSGWQATPGKRVMSIRVICKDMGRSVWLRNLIRFLPWEIAHTGVHWMMYFENKSLPVPGWIMALLLAPQSLVAVYIVSVMITSGSSSLYDGIATTQVEAVLKGK